MKPICSLRPLATGLFFVLATPGCFSLFPNFGKIQGSQQSAMVDGQKAVDAQALQRLEAARAKVKASPGGVAEARMLAGEVVGAFELGTVTRAHLDSEGLLKEMSSALDAALVAHPDKKAEVMFSKGSVLLTAGKTEDGIAALRESMDAKASPAACVMLVPELDKQGDPKKEIRTFCQKTRANLTGDDETKFALLDTCLQHSHASNVEAGLAWAGPADVAFYRSYTQKIQADNLAHRQEENERAARMRAELDAAHAREDSRPAGGARGGSAPSGPAMFSLTLHNSCSKTVKLFFGDKPKFSSGTTTTLGSNNTTSYTGKAGDMIWLVDDSENALSSLSPSGNQRMQITASCGGFAPD